MAPSLPELGVGVVYSPALEPLLTEPDLVSLIEIEPETLWTFQPDEEIPYHALQAPLDRIDRFPQAKLVHGVGFPVGGSRPPDPRHLGPFVETLERLAAPWASEHLGFNRACSGEDPDTFSTGFLLPPLQTPRGAEAAAESIRSVAAELPVPFAVETGVNYLAPRPGELGDGAFVRRAVEAADCGILLDLHNVWANQRNGRQSVDDFVREIPLERVWEVHVAGGNELSGYWLDAHSGAVPEPLMGIVERVLPQLPNVRALVFEILPDYVPQLGLDGVRAQMESLRELWETRRQRTPEPLAPRAIDRRPASSSTRADDLEPRTWEDTLGSLVVGRQPPEPGGGLTERLIEDPGLSVLQRLVEAFRSGMITGNLRLTTRLLLLHGGEELARDLFRQFFATRPPDLFGSVEAEGFADFLAAADPEIPYLPEVLGFERASLRVAFDGESRVVPFRYAPDEVLRPLAEGRLPTDPTRGRYEVEVTPDEEGTTPAPGVISSS